MNYLKSKEFIRLEKLAELEKRVDGKIDSVRNSDSDFDADDVLPSSSGLSGIGHMRTIIPRMVMRALMQKSQPVPTSVLNSCIDDGVDTASAHFSKNSIRISPAEAAYIAIGKKDDSIMDSLSGIKLSDILSMISNRPAVSQYSPGAPMSLDDFDQPKHIKIMIRMKGMSPEELSKTAKDNPLDDSSMFNSMEITMSNGKKMVQGRDALRDNKRRLQELIDDGIIIKIVKLMSGGQKKTVYKKTASDTELDDLLAVMTF